MTAVSSQYIPSVILTELHTTVHYIMYFVVRDYVCHLSHFIGWTPNRIHDFFPLYPRLKRSFCTPLHYSPLLFSGVHLSFILFILGFHVFHAAVSLSVVALTVRSCKWSVYVQRTSAKLICVLLCTCVSHSWTGFLVFASLPMCYNWP
jgi:hypothetical protein